ALSITQKVGRGPRSRCNRRLKTRRLYSTAKAALASYISTWQIRGFCSFFSAINAIFAAVPDQLGGYRSEPSSHPALRRYAAASRPDWHGPQRREFVAPIPWPIGRPGY